MADNVSTPSIDAAALHRFLPEHVVGEVQSITPVRLGLSGAGVYAVTSANGEYILRVQGAGAVDSFWAQHLLIMRRAAERGVAPPLVHVDEAARTIVSARVRGVPLHAALAHRAWRATAIADVVERVRTLHAIDPTGIVERNPAVYARSVWLLQRARPGFPSWALGLESVFDKLDALFARDRRRVVSHNDVNPGNVLWDGARSWLVDWEVAGLGHPYYDLAAFVTFLGFDADRANELLAMQEQEAPTDDARATLAALQQLVALAVGIVFLSMTPDLTIVVPQTRDEAPTLADVRTAMRDGSFDLQSPKGQAMLGLAFLRVGVSSGACR